MADKKTKEPQVLKKAFILDAAFGEKLYQTLGELPIKYSALLTPILIGLEKAPRADVNIKEITDELSTE